MIKFLKKCFTVSLQLMNSEKFYNCRGSGPSMSTFFKNEKKFYNMCLETSHLW